MSGYSGDDVDDAWHLPRGITMSKKNGVEHAMTTVVVASRAMILNIRVLNEQGSIRKTWQG